MYVCNAGAFAGVQYYDPHWRDQPNPGASDYLDVEFSFQVGPGGQFLCDFIEALTDALAVVEPESAVADVELGEELQAICQSAEDAVNGLTGRSTGSWKRDILPKDQAANSYNKLAPASSERSLGTRMVSNGMDTLVLDLYNSAPSRTKWQLVLPPVYPVSMPVQAESILQSSATVVLLSFFSLARPSSSSIS